MISAVPSGNTARTSLTRIASFTFSRILGRRGWKLLGGYIYAGGTNTLSSAEGVKTDFKFYFSSLQFTQKTIVRGHTFSDVRFHAFEVLLML